ncbi:MAG: tetratricopeptide repeat protein [Planctomycetes bacterium]|nr:tetratricopeptide repeat protein [Planctomycetota bacterium]
MIVPGEEVFRAFLQRRTGFVMPEDRWRFLAPRFLGRLGDRGFHDVAAFVRYLEHDPRGRTELEEIYNILTVRKTSFFRNPGTFDALAREVLPRLLCGRSSRLPVSIWSAGCSTGEEAHSLAIVAEAALGPHEQPYHVLATDIVKEALARGRQGVYPEAALQDVPAAYRGHLRRSGGHLAVDERVRGRVEFAVHNLVHDAAPLPATGAWDVIFCRNVLIYFSLEQARAIIEKFARVLAPGGALFLGSAEVFFDMEPEYEVVFSGDTFYYRRRAAARAHPASAPTPAPVDAPIAAPTPPPRSDAWAETRAAPRPSTADTPTRTVRRPPARGPRGESGRWRRPSDAPRPARDAWAVHDAPTARIQGGTGDTPTRAFSRGWPSAGPGVGPAPDGGDGPVDETRADLRIAGALPLDQVLEAERRLEADDREGAARVLRAAITRAPRWARPRVLLARVYQLSGQTDHAARQLETAAEVEPLEPRAHFLLGKLRAEQGDAPRAEEAFRRALYVEPDFLAARLGLAGVYEGAGRADRACKELRTVLRALRAKGGRVSPDALDGLSPQELHARCEAAVSKLGGRLDESGDDLGRLG